MSWRKPLIWVEDESTGCWICTSHSPVRIGEYPRIFMDGKSQLVSRFMYEECFGPIPDGDEVRHKCDNPLCINPEHLELGTHFQNQHDRKRNGTWRSGELGLHKLTWNDVEQIRKEYDEEKNKRGKRTLLAKRYGVSLRIITNVVKRKSWNQNTFGKGIL